MDQRGCYFSTYLVIGVILIIVASTSFLLSPSVFGGESEAQYIEVTVARGDSLWSVAEAFSNSNDIRRAVYDIRQVNGLESPSLQPGQVLRIPVD